MVPVHVGTGEKVAKIGARLISYPHATPGELVMREMQCREQGRFGAGIQRRHETVERRVYCRPIRPRLSLIDGDGPSP
jgi:hypothetical protein